jgi:diguanylate cyclase (GGDEF)-like protein/PAS domain S-box-containing protein
MLNKIIKLKNIRWVTVLSVIVILIIMYSFQLGKNMFAKYTSLLHSTYEMQLKATTAHLWLEEVITGDRNESIESVWKQIDEAHWYLQAMLKGGNNNEGQFYPFEDPLFRQKVKQIAIKLDRFHSVAKKRWKEQEKSGVGSTIDQQFDTIFEDFIQDSKELELDLLQQMEAHENRFQIVQYLLIAVVIFLSLFVGLILSRHESRHLIDIHQLKLEQHNIRDLMESTAEAIIGVDLDGVCTFVNASGLDLLRYENLSDLLGEKIHEKIHYKKTDGSHYPIDECPMNHTVCTGEKSHKDTEVLWRSDGSHFYAEYWSYPVYRENELVSVVITFVDITGRKQAELKLHDAYENLEKQVLERTNELSVANEKLSIMAMHDPLTNLPNRRYFQEYSLNRLAQANRDNDRVAFLYIDLDGFKAINDDISHQAGDKVLISLSDSFKKSIRESEFIGRLGGDEFCMVIYNFKDKEEISNTAKRLINLTTQPISVGGMELEIGMTIGISMFPENGKAYDELLSAADVAMYDGKAHKKGSFVFAS